MFKERNKFLPLLKKMCTTLHVLYVQMRNQVFEQHPFLKIQHFSRECYIIISLGHYNIKLKIFIFYCVYLIVCWHN